MKPLSLTDLAPFTTRGLPGGAVDISCSRCGEAEALPPSDAHGRPLGVLDQVAWCRAHRCRASRPLRTARELLGVA